MHKTIQSEQQKSLWTLVLVVLVFMPGCKDSQSNLDVPRFSPVIEHEGFWRAKSAIMSGTPFDEEVTRSITVKIKNDQYETMVGPEADRGDCIVDKTYRPYRMTIVGKEGPNKGMTYFAIYELFEENTLRICYDLSGKNYPDTFEATKKNGYYTATYQRETPQPAESNQ